MRSVRTAKGILLGCAALVAALLLGATPSAAGDMVEVRGKRLSIFAPAEERAAAKRLAEMGDQALVRYAEDLGFSLPSTRFKIFLYATAEEYEAAELPRTGGVFKQNLAFTFERDAEVHMVFQPRTGRGGVGGDAPGMLEALAMHELSHALQYKTIPSYGRQPAWLSEGVADLCSERALAGGDTSLLPTHPWFADFFHDVNEALDLGTFVSLERLMVETTQVDEAQDRQIRYGTSYALARYLDAPEAPERRAKFRAFLREVNAIPPGEDVVGRANQRFREVFGTPIRGSDGPPSIVALERELVASIREATLCPWQTLYKDVRASGDGSVLIDSFPGSSAVALSTLPALGPRAKIKATVVVGDGPGLQADIIFAYRSRNDFYKLAFGSKGWVTLLRWDGKWRTIAHATIAEDTLPPETPHEIVLVVDVARIGATIDGKAAFRFTMKDKTFGGGRFGIGTYDGRASFKDIQATSN